MSGPKCYRFEVSQDPAIVAARQEAAALAAASGRVEGALARLRFLRDEASGLRTRHGSSISLIEPPSRATAAKSAGMLREAERLERVAAEGETRLRAELGAARTASFVARLGGEGNLQASGGPGLDRLTEAIAKRLNREAGDAGVDAHIRATSREDCARIYERLRADVSERARDQVERTFERALAATHQDRARLLVDRLRAAVKTANAEAEARNRRASVIDALIGNLGDLDKDEATRLRELLLSERDQGRSLELLTGEVAHVRQQAQSRHEAARTESDRERVADALDESLRELGYEVQAGFETALAASGSALAQRSGWTDHAVRVLLSPSTNELRLHVVRDDRPRLISSDNVFRERELCADRPALEHALAERGVRLDPRELIEPGVIPLATVQLAGAGFATQQRKATTQERKQTR
jgi:hypothetical protein